jgi:hypothetical protein
MLATGAASGCPTRERLRSVVRRTKTPGRAAVLERGKPILRLFETL